MSWYHIYFSLLLDDKDIFKGKLFLFTLMVHANCIHISDDDHRSPWYFNKITEIYIKEDQNL